MEPASMDRLHENIRRVRMRLGYSQDDMADLMGIERSTYSNFELGKTKLFGSSMSKFASAVKMSEEEILLDGGPLTAGYLNAGGIEERLDAMETRLKAMEASIGAVETTLGKISGQLEILTAALKRKTSK